VRFLIDECLPPQMAGLLRTSGHDCAHVYDLGLGGQPGEQIMALADRENRILVSADTDFGELLANRGTRPLAAGVAGYPGCVAAAEQAVQRAQAVARNR
jgi:predicted nuclease of predicted toxin-antitoxin system